MKKLLIVSPHFPPVNAPDLHRVRALLPYLRAAGWEPTVLAVAAESIEGGVIEPALEATYPSDIPVVRVRGLPAGVTRRFGVGGLWWRCGSALRRAGDELIARERFDLAFFSTTQFGAFTLGPRWRRRHGLRYVVDYQDPWITSHYRATGQVPPGGWIKFTLNQWWARTQEARVLRAASGVIAVSPAYGPELQRRYRWIDPKDVSVIPFGAPVADFTHAAQHPPERCTITFDPKFVHFVYVGRCSSGMTRALRILFRAFRHHLDHTPETARLCRLHLIGTDYAPASRAKPTTLLVAEGEGVAEYVHEHPARVPYFEALHYAQRADALLAIGSDDPGYTASKLFATFLAQRPTLLLYHRDSPVMAFAQQLRVGTAFGLGDPAADVQVTQRVADEWFKDEAWRRSPLASLAELRPYTAEALAGRVIDVLNRAASGA